MSMKVSETALIEAITKTHRARFELPGIADKLATAARIMKDGVEDTRVYGQFVEALNERAVEALALADRISNLAPQAQTSYEKLYNALLKRTDPQGDLQEKAQQAKNKATAATAKH